nr:PREDICTED: uncharacterized protein LOC105677662 [Linepithema humile]
MRSLTVLIMFALAIAIIIPFNGNSAVSALANLEPNVGLDVGADVDLSLGTDVGLDVGADVDLSLGTDVGLDVGADVDLSLGTDVGLDVGADVGLDVEADVDLSVGTDVGLNVEADVELGDESKEIAKNAKSHTGQKLLKQSKTQLSAQIERLADVNVNRPLAIKKPLRLPKIDKKHKKIETIKGVIEQLKSRSKKEKNIKETKICKCK